MNVRRSQLFPVIGDVMSFPRDVIGLLGGQKQAREFLVLVATPRGSGRCPERLLVFPTGYSPAADFVRHCVYRFRPDAMLI